MFTHTLSLLSAAAVVATASHVALAATPAPNKAKNVILMVSDGCGFNAWEAAKVSGSVQNYDGYTGTDVRFYGMTHDMLNDDGSAQGYDAVQMWNDFNYTKGNNDYTIFTDSAAAATAMYTGTKTTKGRVSTDINGNNLKTFFEYAADSGKATGAISSVQYNHATPACVDAHNDSRNNYNAIAAEMFSSDLDVIMGGDSKTSTSYTDAAAAGFTVISDANMNDWDDLADGGSYQGGATPTKVFGGFAGSNLNVRTKPTLELMTKGALQVLSQDNDGFAMMVEGGAVDWDNHGNHFYGSDGMLEEQKDFDNAVNAVIDWVENNSNWDETMVIITSDHETGMMWGEGTWTDNNGNNRYDDGIDTFNGFERVKDNDNDGVANVLYGSGGHTNQLVPLWVLGNSGGVFDSLITGNDAQAATFWGSAFDSSAGWNGDLIDNTDIFTGMMQGSDVPEPATMVLLGLGGLAVVRRRA